MIVGGPAALAAPDRRTPAGQGQGGDPDLALGRPVALDTFDPKPEAGYDYCGPLNKPIATNVPGIRIASCCPCWPSRPTSTPSSAA